MVLIKKKYSLFFLFILINQIKFSISPKFDGNLPSDLKDSNKGKESQNASAKEKEKEKENEKEKESRIVATYVSLTSPLVRCVQ